MQVGAKEYRKRWDSAHNPVLERVRLEAIEDGVDSPIFSLCAVFLCTLASLREIL